MKRSTCIICRKKRLHKFLLKVDVLKTHAYYDFPEKHFVCKEECKEKYIQRLSDQVRQLNSIIKKINCSRL